MSTIRDLLNEEIVSEFEKLSNFQPGSKERKELIDSISTLYKLNIEECKIDELYREQENRFELEHGKIERENEYRNIQEKNNKISQYFKYGIEACGIMVPVMFYGHWLRKGFKFEETGIYSSPTFRSFFSKLKPTRR